jgi:hypothetical protein
MPSGPGTYGSKVGRPSKKNKNAYMHGGKPHKKKKFMGGGKIQPGPSVDGMDVATNVAKPNKTMRGVGAATRGIKFFG